MLRILCFHGYLQNASAFKIRLASIHRFVKKFVEFEYIDAPIEINAPYDDSEGHHDSQRAWYRLEPENQYPDILNTLTYVNNYFKDHGPFDGVFGFSQGSMLINIMNNIMESDKSSEYAAIKFKFSMLFSGISLKNEEIRKLSSKEIETPAFICYGLTDKVLNLEDLREFTTHYKNKEVKEHEGGHFIPGTKEMRNLYLEYVKKYIN